MPLDRRRFMAAIAGGLLAAPLAAEAQQAGKVYRIGYLSTRSSTTGMPPEVFRQGLRELGWIEGRNIVFDYGFAEGRFERLPELAAELVRLKVDMIVAVQTPAAAAAKNATPTIPIVGISSSTLLGSGSSPASRARAGTSQGCPSTPAWKLSARRSIYSRRLSPRSAMWRSSRTRPIQASRPR